MMLIELRNDPTTDDYLKEHGLELKRGTITGELINFDSNKTFEDTSSLEQAYYNVLKAYEYSRTVPDKTTAYINDLTVESIDRLINDGFDINIYGVLTVKDVTYAEYQKIKYSRDVTYRGTEMEALMRKLIIHWQTIDIITGLSDPEKIIYRTTSPRFDYEKGAKRFHHIMAVPFFSKEIGMDHVHVLIDCVEDIYGGDSKYVVSICDRHFINTDLEPTPDNLPEILRRDNLWSTRFKKFLKSL